MPTLTIQETVRRRANWLPWAVLTIMAGLTVTTWWLLTREMERTAWQRFDRLAERVSDGIRLRFNTAAHLLHAAAALPESSEHVTAHEWSVYLRRAAAQLDSGVVGLGYMARVPRGSLDKLETQVRAEGAPDYAIRRLGTYPWIYAVVAIEPQERNTGLGLDMSVGNIRRSAAEAAAAGNTMVLSNRMRFKYDNKLVPGFLLFLPVYEKGAALESPEQRISALQGWVYASIRIDQFMTGVMDMVAGQLNLEVFDGDGTSPDTLLNDATGYPAGQAGRPDAESDYAGRSFHKIQPLDIHGRRWTLRFSTLPKFDLAGVDFLPGRVLVVGLVFSVLAALLTWVLLNARHRALQRADDMITDLRRLALVAGRTANVVLLTDKNWQIEWINASFTRLLGYELNEVKGREPGSFLAGPETDPQTMAAMREASKMSRPFQGEILNYTKSGEKIWMEIEIQPLFDAAGKLQGFMSLQLDITARKHQAMQLREAKEAAEKANVAKGQFLAMMSHEIRTPMNGVIGMASLLLDSPMTPEQRESAETIRQSGQALLAIINDILDFSKIESGRQELESTDFSLRDCVEGAVDVLAATAAQKRIDLLCEISEDAPAMVCGDPVRLRQVLVNLIGNAVKFTERGEVLVKVRTLTRSGSDIDLLLTVWDTGIGIPAEHMERIFQPFSQVDASTTRRFGGTGLGLAICRRLVELMGGRISVESEVGRGSSFSFILRLQELPEGALIPAARPAGLQARRVLIVEDNATSRRILSGQIRHWGMQPVAVETSALALARLRSDEKFDVAIIDLQMPDVDGGTLAQGMGELPGRAGLPLILLAPPGRREIAPGLFVAVLTKPVKPAQLFDVLIGIFSRTNEGARPIKPGG